MARSSGPVLRTQRLVMEPIRREDSDDLFEAVVSQDSVMRWLAIGRADSRSAAGAMCDDHVAHWTRHGYGDFAVRDAATHAFLGRVGLRNRAPHGVDLGFALHPRAQGRGIAREAGRACLDLAFRRLSLPAVFAFVLPDNTASIAALRRLGAQADGTVQSSGLHCLRYRFDPTATAAAEPVVNDDGCADLQLVHAPGPGSPDDRAALRDGHPDPFGVNAVKGPRDVAIKVSGLLVRLRGCPLLPGTVLVRLHRLAPLRRGDAGRLLLGVGVPLRDVVVQRDAPPQRLAAITVCRVVLAGDVDSKTKLRGGL